MIVESSADALGMKLFKIFMKLILVHFIAGIVFLTTYSLSLTLITAIVSFIIIFFWKFLFMKRKDRVYKKNKGKGFLKEYLIWFIAFTLGIFVSFYVTDILPIYNLLLFYLIIGFVIECFSKIMQILILNNRWTIDRHFVFWVIVQAGLFYITFSLASFILPTISRAIPYKIYTDVLAKTLYFLILGLIQTALVRLVWVTKLEKKIFG